MPAKAPSQGRVEKHIEAMAHPLRHKAWIILHGREASPKEIADELNADTALVSHHVKRLVKLGCAELLREESVRGKSVRHVYRATRWVAVEDHEWMRLIEENPPFARHLLCGFMQSQLDDFRASVESGALGTDEHWHVSRVPAVVDQVGLEQALQLAMRFEEDLAGVVREAAARRSDDGGDAIDISAHLSIFKSARR